MAKLLMYSVLIYNWVFFNRMLFWQERARKIMYILFKWKVAMVKGKEKGLIVTGTKVNQELKSDMLSTCDSSMFLKIVNYEPILLLWLCFIMKVQKFCFSTYQFFFLQILISWIILKNNYWLKFRNGQICSCLQVDRYA